MKRQLKSFKAAFKGIFTAFATESHLRFHLVAAIFVLLFAYIGEMNTAQFSVLFVTIGVVFATELFNTAIELLCDLYTKEHNPTIGKIKDISAGAVLVTAIAAALVALAMFIFTGKLIYAFERLIANPIYFLPVGILAAAAFIFVLFGGRKEKKK